MDIDTLKLIIKDINFVLERFNMEVTHFSAGDDIELTIKKKVKNDRTETDPHH